MVYSGLYQVQGYQTDTTWQSFNRIYTTAGVDYGTSATASDRIIWQSWHQGTAISGSYCGSNTSIVSTNVDTAWVTWSGVYVNNDQIYPEQSEAQRLLLEQQQAQLEQLQIERQKASEKARELLLSNLTAEQKDTYEREQHLIVIGKHSKNRYRIRHGRSRNIELLDSNDRVIRRYCAHPQEVIPDEDTVLAQKLMLEHSEQEFLRIANAS